MNQEEYESAVKLYEKILSVGEYNNEETLFKLGVLYQKINEI